MTVQLTAANLHDILEISLGTIGISYIYNSFRLSISNWWIDEVCKDLDNAINDDGTKKYTLLPDIDTFKLNLDELYFGWQHSLEQQDTPKQEYTLGERSLLEY